MRLSLGPNQFYWRRTDINLFYEQMLETPLDVIYLGEVVCGKRDELRAADWIELACALADNSDKQVVLSTLALLESGADFSWVRKVCDNGRLLVEANDMAAVELLAEAGLPFTCGPAINLYNHRAVAQLMTMGMQRWTAPVEMSGHQLGEVLTRLTHKPEVEVLAHGLLPLAYSARCFTARHLGLSKDNCGRRCIEFASGIPLTSQEDQSLFVMNGIQTLSGEPVNLLRQMDSLRTTGVDLLRLSPQVHDMRAVIDAFDRARNGDTDLTLLLLGVDGYWRGQCGFDLIASG
ncbi:U32 family peptidase [Microbulbifer harenosus]|uniref:Ubiquinone biosynthesis protein UbiV n=1 Tax=Microbulbifer harenosus TaxID=2576840 RepID=A0ABY2UD84_9GAMM|nr:MULTISPECIES: U32 family peptidase [Microbulbifer]QIL90582.1 U32 family peptidase [Microbulbifer sp. SH-1]TLM74353.1 U32 family peptidase [Microbulbifer harenosus]